jgi:spore germination protein
MSPRNKIKLTFLSIILAVLLTGCWDQRIFEQTGFILQMGVETGKDGRILFTRTLPVLSDIAHNEIEIIVSEADLVREGREMAKRVSSKSIEGGKMQQIYFSTEFARKGIHELLEIFERNPINPLLANVVVVDGSPRELIETAHEFKDKPRLAFYVNYLLENNRRDAYIPETRIYNFDIDYFAEGIDPLTPRIRLTKDAIEVTGSALFDGDKMVGEIDPAWTGLIMAMKNKKKGTEYIFQDKSLETDPGINKKGIAVMLREADCKISVMIKNGLPQIQVALKYDTSLTEYKWDDMNDDKLQEQLEERISKSVTEECNKLIRYMQEVGSDPVGFGELVRTKQNSYWKSIDWKKVYGEADITATARIEILQYGAIN